jgi:hypothetical protein
MRLGCILNDSKAGGTGNSFNRVNVNGLSIKMYGNDCRASPGDRAIDPRCRHQQRRRVDVYENWRSADREDSVNRSEEGIGRYDDFIARPYIQRG